MKLVYLLLLGSTQASWFWPFGKKTTVEKTTPAPAVEEPKAVEKAPEEVEKPREKPVFQPIYPTIPPMTDLPVYQPQQFWSLPPPQPYPHPFYGVPVASAPPLEEPMEVSQDPLPTVLTAPLSADREVIEISDEDEESEEESEEEVVIAGHKEGVPAKVVIKTEPGLAEEAVEEEEAPAVEVAEKTVEVPVIEAPVEIPEAEKAEAPVAKVEPPKTAATVEAPKFEAAKVEAPTNFEDHVKGLMELSKKKAEDDIDVEAIRNTKDPFDEQVDQLLAFTREQVFLEGKDPELKKLGLASKGGVKRGRDGEKERSAKRRKANDATRIILEKFRAEEAEKTRKREEVSAKTRATEAMNKEFRLLDEAYTTKGWKLAEVKSFPPDYHVARLEIYKKYKPVEYAQMVKDRLAKGEDIEAYKRNFYASQQTAVEAEKKAKDDADLMARFNRLKQ